MAKKPHVLIVESRYYEDVADNLLAGTVAELTKAGCTYDKLTVPGTFEVPGAIRFAIKARRKGAPKYDGYVALGCVIKGETDHYDHICRETSRAIMDIAQIDLQAVGFGILTCPTYQHAKVRADVKGKNKGAEVARAVLRMIELRQDFKPSK